MAVEKEFLTVALKAAHWVVLRVVMWVDGKEV